MKDLGQAELLDLVEVRLDAFATCEVERSCSLAVPPLPINVIHFVLAGEGSLDCEAGTWPLRPGMIMIIPRNMPKRINGPGPSLVTFNAEEGCPFAPGIVTFKACPSGVPGLVLGCGSVTAMLGGHTSLLDSLQKPMMRSLSTAPLPLLFEAMISELKRPKPGTKGFVEALMKQVFILLLRRELRNPQLRTPLGHQLRDPRLARAVAAILARPQDPHSLDSLALLAGMSRSRFNHHFNKAYGCSPMEFVQSARLKAAARLLRKTKLPVKSVAAAVGYASRSHFSRAFRGSYGIDPSTYRQAPPAAPDARPHDLNVTR